MYACPVATDELVVVVAAGHRWSQRRRPLAAAELAGTALVAREAGSGTRQALERALARAGGPPPVPPALELSTTTAIRGAVLAGAGPAALSSLAVSADLANGTLVRVPVTDLDPAPAAARDLDGQRAPGRTGPGPAADRPPQPVRISLSTGSAR